MVSDVHKAKRYRERAAGLHKIAGDLPAGNAQRMIVGIAMEYDRLAGLFEPQASVDNSTSAVASLKELNGPDQ
jgi:hypothetical protein